MSRRRVIEALTLAAFLAAGAPLRADTPDQRLCLAAKAPDALAACTRWFGVTKTAEDRASALLGRALVQDGRGATEAAFTDVEAAVKLAPRRADLLVTRGNLWVKKNDLGRAIADFDAAIRIDPTMPETYVNRANMRERRNEFDLALADFDQAIRLAPTFVPAINGKAWVLHRAGRHGEALPFADRAIALAPDAAYAYDTRARIHEALGDLDRAIADIRKGLALDPAETEIREAGARIEAKLAGLKAIASTSPERRVALVIGNAAYDSVGRLKNTENDARAVAERLRALGFQEVRLATNLKRDATVQALGDFARLADGADWAIIYYAGHGIEIDRANWLVPIDATLKSDRDVRFQAVSLDQALAAVEGAKRMRMVVLDACRDNPFLAQMTRSGSVTRSVQKGLGGIEPKPGTQVLFAAKDGEVAQDGDGANSPFVIALLKHINTPSLEIGRLFRRVTDEVLRQTENKQQPHVYGTLPDQDFFFRR